MTTLYKRFPIRICRLQTKIWSLQFFLRSLQTDKFSREFDCRKISCTSDKLRLDKIQVH